MHLWMNFYFVRPVFDSEQLESLHSLLAEALPQWSSGLKVLKSEYKRGGRDVVQGSSLFAAVNQEAPARRGIGNAVLKGSYDGLSFFLSTCHSTLPPELNYISVEIDQALIESEEPSQWAYQFFKDAVSRLTLRYARAYMREEFDAKNMVSDDEGVRAIGVHLDESLPGLYWLNFFGNPYLDLIGRDRLLSVPAHDVREISNGVFVGLDASPMKWVSEAYRTTEEAVIEHIGCQYVFSRVKLDRNTVAPDFKLGNN